MRNIYYVYIYIDPRTNLPFYIGKGKGKRSEYHLSETHLNTTNWAKWRQINDLRKEGLNPIIKIIKSDLNNEEAYALEEELIKSYGRKGIDTGGILTNVTLGINPPVRKGPRNDRKRTGKDHPMYGRSYFDIWVNKYGYAEATRLQKEKSDKSRAYNLGRKMNYSDEMKLYRSEFARKLNMDRIWISNDLLRKNKHPKREALEAFLEEGWYIGKTLYNGFTRKDNSKTQWINNGSIRKRIRIDESIPEDWTAGRGSF